MFEEALGPFFAAVHDGGAQLGDSTPVTDSDPVDGGNIFKTNDDEMSRIGNTHYSLGWREYRASDKNYETLAIAEEKKTSFLTPQEKRFQKSLRLHSPPSHLRFLSY